MALCLAIMPVLAFCQATQGPQIYPEWLQEMGGASGTINPIAIKTDAAGNIYITGTFTGAVDFDPSSGVRSLSIPPATTSGFIAKYQSNGTLVWAYSLTGADVVPSSITVNNGAIGIAGKFNGSFDADPGIATHMLIGVDDAFVINLKDDGSFIWAQSIGGAGIDAGNDIASDASGNIYAALQFQQTIAVGGTSYTAKGVTDGMLIKYDALGNVVFAIDLGYVADENSVSGVAVDNAGNIDIIGYLNGPVNFNPLGIPFAKSATNSIYIAQYLPDGKLKWVNSVEQGFQNNNHLSIALNSADEIFIAADFAGTLSFGPTFIVHARGTKDLVVARYSPAGDLGIYKTIGRVGAAVMPSDIGISPDGKYYYISGIFTGSVDFSTNVEPHVYDYHGQQDLFLAKYNATDGNLVVVTTAGNNSCAKVSANGLATVNNDKVLLTGTFCSMVPFGGSTCTVYNATASGSQDMFLAQYSQPLPITNNLITNAANCSGGPDVLTGSAPAGGTGVYRYEWESATDGSHFSIMPGVTGVSYSPTVTGSDIYYRRIVISGECNDVSRSNPTAVGPSSGAVQNNKIDVPAITEGCLSFFTSITGQTPTHGGGVYIYQWQQSPNGITGWTNIFAPSGQADAYQKKDAENLGGFTTTYVRRMVSVPGCDAVPSNVIKLTVYPPLGKLEIHATNKQTEFCGQGDPGTFISDSPVPSGGNGTDYGYQWLQASPNPADGGFKPIPGAIGATYSPGILYETTFFKRDVRSGPCFTGDPGFNSTQITITVKKKINMINNITPPNDGPLCRADANPSNIVGQAPSGGTGDFAIQWQRSTDNFQNNIENIANANDNDYDPPKIDKTTYYRRVVTFSGENECSLLPSISAVVTATVSTANVTNNNIRRSSQDPDLFCSTPAKPHQIAGDPAVGSGFRYQWQSSTDGGSTFQDITDATDKNYDPPETKVTTTYHRLVIIDDKCLAPLTSNDVVFAVSASASTNKITAPATTVFCNNGDAGVIDGSEVTGTGVHYQWQSSPDGQPGTFTDINQAIYYNYDPLPSTATVYYRRSVTTDVCNVPSVTEPVAIEVYQTPVVTMSTDITYLCAGDKITLAASGGTHYKWTPADGLSADDVASPTASPKITTIYNVDVSNSSNGSCAAPGSVKVIVIPKPIVSAGADRRMFRGNAIKLQGNVIGEGVHYSWSPATYLDDPNSLTPTAKPDKTITYTLTATTDHSCSIVTSDVKISVFEKVVVPTGFTPNGDGVNDLWEILGLNTYPDNILTVYNRNGAEVFRTIGYAKVWDGIYQGHALPFGTYYYVIDLKDGTKPLSGWVSLIR